MIQLWSAISVAVLTVVVGPLLRGEISGRLAKRIALHADIRQKLEDVPDALTHMDMVIASEAQSLKERETHRLTRKLNAGNVAALIFIALVGRAIVYGLVSIAIAIAIQDTAVLFWLIILVTGVVGAFVVALAAVGLGALYEPPREKSKKAR